VLYEALTGQQLFQGETISDVLAAVLTKEPDWERVPAKVRPLLRRCLEKDPKQRLRDIGDARLVLDKVIAGAPEDAAAVAAATTVGVPVRGRGLPWVIAGVLGAGLLAALWWPRERGRILAQ